MAEERKNNNKTELTEQAEPITESSTTEVSEATETNESTVVFEDKWFNVEDIAEYLSIKPDTARQWVREGKLPAYKAGKRYKLKLSEVDEWVRSGKITE